MSPCNERVLASVITPVQTGKSFPFSSFSLALRSDQRSQVTTTTVIARPAGPWQSPGKHVTKAQCPVKGTILGCFTAFGAYKRKHCTRRFPRRFAPRNDKFFTLCFYETVREIPIRNAKNPAGELLLSRVVFSLSTFHPERQRQQRLRLRQDRACRPPEIRWSARSLRWRRRFPGWNG